ncbi:MAG: hypothetical protein WBD22_08500 [Pyrinomonadaceae bacterium]
MILGLSLVSFSDNLITDIGQESNSDPKFIIHGLFCLAWMVLFAIQTNLIRSLNYTTHQWLGIATLFVGAGVVASTLYVFVSIWEGWDKLVFYARPNRFLLPSFAVLIVLGYLNRENADKHKRFMYLATLYMMGPILDRIGAPFGISPLVANPLVWNGLFLSLFLYDWVTLRRIHPITYLGFIWLYVVWAIAVLT